MSDHPVQSEQQAVPEPIAPKRVHISEYIDNVSTELTKAFMHMEGQLHAKDQEIKSMLHAAGGQIHIEAQHMEAALKSILHVEKHEGGSVTVTVRPVQ